MTTIDTLKVAQHFASYAAGRHSDVTEAEILCDTLDFRRRVGFLRTRPTPRQLAACALYHAFALLRMTALPGGTPPVKLERCTSERIMFEARALIDVLERHCARVARRASETRASDVVTETCAACLGRDPACDVCNGVGTVRSRVRAATPKQAPSLPANDIPAGKVIRVEGGIAAQGVGATAEEAAAALPFAKLATEAVRMMRERRAKEDPAWVAREASMRRMREGALKSAARAYAHDGMPESFARLAEAGAALARVEKDAWLPLKK